MANRRIDYTIGFKPDKSGLNSIYNSLKEIQQMTAKDYMIKFGKSNNIYQARTELEAVQNQVLNIANAYSKSFDSKLGIVNLRNFDNELRKCNIESKDLFTILSKVGKEDVFSNIIKDSLTANVQLEKTTSFLDKMGETLTSTVRWGISSRLMNSFVGSVKGSFTYIKELDTSLNDIRIVTGKSADEMSTFAKEANKAASALGSTTKTYTDASLIYFQQGLSDSEVRARAETTIKTANVTGQTGEEVSEQLTAVWNGYKVSAAETEMYVDKLAAVAATTASNLEELSTGMSKVASAANVMGVDVDQLNAMLSTTISVTRQAPESVGTAYKTIFARIGDIEAGNGEVTLGQYTEKMKEIGFNVLDANNKLRNQGEVIEEIGSKWNTLSREQQIALAQTMAGARQYNNLLALFDNWNMYTKAIETSKNATGTLQKQQDVYKESTEAHLKELTAAQEQFQASLLDPETINEVADALKAMFNVFAKGVDALGGGAGVLLNFGSILTMVFSKQIAANIVPIVNGFKAIGNQSRAVQQIVDNVQTMANLDNLGSKVAIPNLAKRVEGDIKTLNYMNPQQLEQMLGYYTKIAELESQLEAHKIRKTETAGKLNLISQATGGQEITADTNFNSKEVNQMMDDRAGKIDQFTSSLQQIEQQSTTLVTRTGDNQKKVAESVAQQAQDLLLKFNDLNGLQFFNETQYQQTKKRIEEIQQLADKVLNPKGTIKENTRLEYLSKNLQKKVEERKKDYIPVIDPSTKKQKVKVGYGQVFQDQDGNEITTRDIKTQVIQEYNKGIQPAVEDTNALGEKIKEVTQNTQLATEASKGFEAQVKEGAESTDQLKNSTEAAKNSAEGLSKAVNLQRNIQSIVQLTSSLSMSMSIMNNIANLPNIWQSQEDGATKAAQTIFNLAQFAIPAVVSGINTIRTATTALQASMGWIGIIGMALGAIIGVGQAIVNWQENERKARIENNKAIIEENKTRQEEIDSNTDLYNSYAELEKKYKNGDISKKELLSSTDELIDAYDIENGKLLQLTNQYETLTGAIRRKRLEEAKENRDIAKENVTASKKILQDSYNKPLTRQYDSLWYITGEQTNDVSANQKVQKNNEAEAEKILDLFEKAGLDRTKFDINTDGGTTYISQSDGLGLIDLDPEKIQQLYDNLENLDQGSGEFTGYNDLINDLKEYLESDEFAQYSEFKKEQNNTDFLVRTLDKNLDSATSYEEYSKILKQIQNEMDIDPTEFYSFVEELGTEYSSIYAAAESLKEKTTDKKVKEKIDSLSKEDLAIVAALDIDEKTSVENIEDAISAVKEQIKPEDLNVIATIRAEVGTDGLGDKIQENLTGYDDFTKNIENRSLFRQTEAINAIGSDYIKNNQNYLSDMLDADTRNQLSSQYQDNIRQLYKDYTHLENYNRAKSKGGDVTLDDVTIPQLGLDIKDEEEVKRITELRKEYFDSWQEGGGLKEGKSFEEFLEKVYGKEAIEGFATANNYLDIYTQGLEKYGEELSSLEINNLVFDQLKEETNQILSNFDAIKEAGSLIGEGFVVAADDLEEFASKFPELLKDYEVLSDGSIKLSQKQVETTIGGIHEEQKAKAEAQIQELEIQKELLQLRLDSIREQKENALKFLQGKISQGEYEQNAVTIANQYKKDLSDTLAKNDIANFKEVLAAQGITIEDEIKNVDKLGETYAKLGAYASAALRGQDPGEWGASLASAVISKSEELNQDVFDAIGSTYNFDELTKENKESLNKALQEYKQYISQEVELEDNIAEIDKEIVLLKSGMNASINSVNDSLGEQIDLLEDILDIYHDINNELTQIDTLLNKINEEQDRLTGQDYINALNDENNLLDAQIAKLNKKKEIGKAEAAGLKDQLTGYGFIFNEDGTVANYESAMLANAQIVQDAQMSGDEDAAERAQEQYDKMKEALERYEEVILNEIPGYDEETREALNKQIENNIKKFHYELDLHVNLNTLEKDFNTFQQNMLDDNDLAGKFNLQADYLFDSHAMSNITEQADEVQKIMGEIQKMENGQTSEIFGDNIAAAYEELETATKNLQDSTVAVKQAFDEALNTYLSMMDQLSEAMDEQQSLYDKVNGILEHRKNVISMVFGEDSYKEFDMYYQKQHENNVEAIEAARSSRDYWASVMEQEEEGSELWLKAKENWEASVDTLNSRVEDSISNLKAQYDNAIKLIFQRTNEQITNGKGLDYLKYEWDYIKEDSAQYLDNVDRSYQISKFSANIEKQINSSSSASAKKRLADFQQQELEMLENKDKLSQYDIDRSNKKLEILQAQIALEDAQNNKSSMRLRRDSQGNYSYQFVADTSAVDKAQEDLQNSIHDLYTLDKERLQATTDGYYNAWTKMQEELATAMQTLQGEELEARVQQIKDHYQPLLEGYSKDITQANDNLSQSALANLSLFNDEAKISTDKIVDYLTGDETGSGKLETEFINSLNKVGVNFEQSLPESAKAGLPKVAEQVGLVQQALDLMFDNVLEEAAEFQLKLGQIEQASGESFKDYTTNAGKAYEKTKQLVEYQGKLITQYKNKLGISRETLKKLEDLAEDFGDIATNAEAAAEAAMKLFTQKYTADIDVTGFTESIDALIEKLGEYTAAVGNITNYTGGPSIGSGGKDNKESNEKDEKDKSLTPTTKNLQDIGGLYNIDVNGNVGKRITKIDDTNLSQDHKMEGSYGEKNVFAMSNEDGRIVGSARIWERTIKGNNDPLKTIWKDNGKTTAYWDDIEPGTKIYIGKTVKAAQGKGTYNKVGFYQDDQWRIGYIGSTVTSLDTGGYTGKWNSKKGKMAVLHEKELVLNAKDTENILSAVQLMRKQQNLLNALSVSAIAQKQAMLDRINARITADVSSAATDLNQNVHIEASFPNVRDSRQIEEAFDNLVNMAAQYANKKLL